MLRKISRILMCVAIFASILSLSMVTAIIRTNEQTLLANLRGNYKMILEVNLTLENKIQYKPLINFIEKNITESEIEMDDFMIPNDYYNKFNIRAVLNNRSDEWKPTLLKGRYFNHKENSKSIVVGRNVSKELGDITIFGEKYTIIGIIGGNSSIFDNDIIFSMRTLPNELVNKIESDNTLKFKIKNQVKVPLTEVENLGNKLKENYKVVEYRPITSNESVDVSSFQDEKKEYQKMMAVLWIVFLITCFNITYFIMFDKRQVFAIKKLHGASNINVYFDMCIELFKLTGYAIILAIVFEALISKLILPNYGYNIEIIPLDFLNSILLSFISVLIAPIIPLVSLNYTNVSAILKE